jgi:hypothetical protein
MRIPYPQLFETLERSERLLLGLIDVDVLQWSALIKIKIFDIP